MKDNETKKAVRLSYGKIAESDEAGCSSACSCRGGTLARNISKVIGYSDEEMDSVPEGANLGLGCGNPVALASLKKGETVLDLGSGAGFDCFLAANEVGSEGRVIGIDMTPEMIEKSRANARKSGCHNVEFRLGEIENLPVADNTADVVISNCVVNLSTDKKRVFKEAFRVLKSKGRLMISDLVLLRELPKSVAESIEAYVGCLAGAMPKKDYLQIIRDAGFEDVGVIEETLFPIELIANDTNAQAIIDDLQLGSEEIERIAHSVLSVRVRGVKPQS